jgi:hypothetical protein
VLVALAVALPFWRTLRGRHAFETLRPGVGGAPWAWQRVLEPWERLAPCPPGALSCPVSALPSCGRAPPARAVAVRRARDRPELELSAVGHHRAELERSNARTTGPSWRCRTRTTGAELALSDAHAPPSALAVGAC